MKDLLEVHIGLGSIDPNSEFSDPTSSFPEFEWRQVYETIAGKNKDRAYLGHSVEGELFAIGTAQTNSVDAPELIQSLVPRISSTPGSRLEVEVLSESNELLEVDVIQGIRKTLESVCEGQLQTVPAPLLERHLKVPSLNRSPGILTFETLVALADYDFFELTTFGPELVKAIVTVAGDDLAILNDNATDISEKLTKAGQGDVTLGLIEQIVGCWRPQTAQ